MFEDRAYRLISYHDTWLSVDPVVGCPNRCRYCVLRHGSNCGRDPEVLSAPSDTVRALLDHPYFVKTTTPLTVGSETDILHPLNLPYLQAILQELSKNHVDNPIFLVTKSAIGEAALSIMRANSSLSLVVCLSLSGLKARFEPDIDAAAIKRNFRILWHAGIPVIHFWRPLVAPHNTGVSAINEMLEVVSKGAEASVVIGLKLHPALTRLFPRALVDLPPAECAKTGEWISESDFDRIVSEVEASFPTHPVYRHTACAVALVTRRPNHTATMYREDVCQRSRCPPHQRAICQAAKRPPSPDTVRNVLSRLPGGDILTFEIFESHVAVHAELSQEQYIFILHNLKFPIRALSVKMINLYHGDIFRHAGSSGLDSKPGT